MDLDRFKPWKRMPFNDSAIYILPGEPNWVVPNRAGDEVIQSIQRHQPYADILKTQVSSLNGNRHLGLLRLEQFLTHFPKTSAVPYTGRKRLLALDSLDECWLHITQRCNAACRHCLFGCSPHSGMTLSLEDVTRTVKEAYGLGTRIFYLTGGEPLLHPEFAAICRLILETYADTRLVILTNGQLIPERQRVFDALPAERLHLQISLDGLEAAHDQWRGQGSHRKLLGVLEALAPSDLKVSLAMAVHAGNVRQMPDMVDIAARFNVSTVHYLWLFVTGKAKPEAFVPPGQLLAVLLQAESRADAAGVAIDNIKALEARIFSPAGTKYDLGNAGWQSLAVGPDGLIYPTPALVGCEDLRCGAVPEGLETVWRSSPQLARIRALSVVQDARNASDPLRFLVGGSDLDHSYYAGGEFIGHDPYLPLHNRLALWLIDRAARTSRRTAFPQIKLKMGDRLLNCHQDGQGVALTHSNCVLPVAGTHEVVGDFYSAAAAEPNPDIANPVCYPEGELTHIPASAQMRSYGCGSPVLDAALVQGEVVVDLGSGAGLECFIAARQVGSGGWVYGIDMLDHMLQRAQDARDEVAQRLGYGNVAFKKGFLEALPLEDLLADVVISNCVINLSEDKHRTFAEIFRVLKPGGRVVISDVVAEKPFPATIQNDAKLRGECIGGAMVQSRLLAMLETVGFQHIRLIKRFFYREVQGHTFYSLTFSAYRPLKTAPRSVIYPGPFAGVLTDEGRLLLRGQKAAIAWPDSSEHEPHDALFLLDRQGNINNLDAQNGCACYLPPETKGGNAPVPGNGASEPERAAVTSPAKFKTGCLRCGKALVYLNRPAAHACSFCGQLQPADALCEAGHFVCDVCHSKDAVGLIKHVCRTSGETDMIRLLNRIRRHPQVPLHGPEHHFAVPGVVLATYRNLGGPTGSAEILAAIERGQSIPGGSCAFWGTCGAALGVGIAFGVLLESNPLKPHARQVVQQITAQISEALGAVKAARCCQRETWTALKIAAELSRTLLPVALKAEGATRCTQKKLNQDCPGEACPYY